MLIEKKIKVAILLPSAAERRGTPGKVSEQGICR